MYTSRSPSLRLADWDHPIITRKNANVTDNSVTTTTTCRGSICQRAGEVKVLHIGWSEILPDLKLHPLIHLIMFVDVCPC